MGITTKILLGVIAFLTLSLGGMYINYAWWTVPKLERKIDKLVSEAEKSRLREAAKEAEIKILKEKVPEIRRKKVNVWKKIDEAVGTADHGRILELFAPYRLRQDNNPDARDSRDRGTPSVRPQPKVGAAPQN